jgi:hypothetical protein
MALVMDGRGETDEERMVDAKNRLTWLAHNISNDIEAVEVVRDDEPTESERIRAACVQAIKDLGRWIVDSDTIREKVANDLRAAIGRPKKQEKRDGTDSE